MQKNTMTGEESELLTGILQWQVTRSRDVKFVFFSKFQFRLLKFEFSLSSQVTHNHAL